MRGNRATQRSGLVELSRFLYLRGVDGRDGLFLLFQLFTRPFPFLSPHPFQKFPSHNHNSVSTRPTKQGTLAYLSNLRVVCHSVNVYRFSLRFSAHCNSPFYSCDPFHDHSSICSTSLDSCFTSGMDDPPSSHNFSRGQHIRHAHLYRRFVCIYHRYNHNAMRSAPPVNNEM